MPLIKIGKDYYNGHSSDIYLLQGTATRDAEIRSEKAPAKVGIAVAKAEDGSTLFVDLNGWRDRKPEVAAIRKLDSVLAIGTLSTREYNGATQYSLDANFVAVSGSGIGAALPSSAAGNAGTGTSASFLDELQDIGDGELPF